MAGKAVISLTTGLEDTEKVTVAFLVAVRRRRIRSAYGEFQAKEAVRLALDGTAAGVAVTAARPCRPARGGTSRRAAATWSARSASNAKQLDRGGLLANAELAGSVQLWEWIGDEGATTFSY